ncbi:ATP-binding protein [Flavobacterium sp.]|uniref:sensor histidine kinase n=1 Tax=Flavobacterium sp. TaxID=239 RepID=UPI00262D35B1|nr:ATP-binding protein [Flavobacterium sp.]
MKLSHQRALLSTQIEMQQQTMQHIGREIHDNIGQQLTLASLYTQQLAYENKAPQISESIENISNIINNSLAELRQLSKTLTDDSIAQKSIAALLQTECEKVNGFKKCQFHYNAAAKQLALSYEVKSILIRIVQEFLQNSIKHSDCKTITVALNKTDSQIELHLKDDGKGFDTKTISNGIGLNNMKKRAEIIGGIYTLESNHEGTNLTIQIPL